MENKKKKPTIEDAQKVISTFAKACYVIGKVEGCQGDMKDNSQELTIFPLTILKEMFDDVYGDEEEEEEEIKPQEDPNEEELEEMNTQDKKITITKAKEKKLIKKYGQKPMEKLARQMKFEGKILNNKQKQHAN